MGSCFSAAEPTKKTAKILFSVSGGNIKEIQGGSVHCYGITGDIGRDGGLLVGVHLPGIGSQSQPGVRGGKFDLVG